jgi:hypothetical protein
MPNIGCDEHIIPHEAEHLMNSVTHRASSNPGRLEQPMLVFEKSATQG